jgi:DNA repair protein RadD
MTVMELPATSRPTITLRPYQQAARERVFEEFGGGARSTLVVHATGLGKSILAGSIARDVIDDHGGRVLILAHRGLLIKQLADSMAALGVEAAVEQAENNARASLWGEPDCVVGSVQTMQRRRLMGWPRKYFKLIIVDECHRSRRSRMNTRSGRGSRTAGCRRSRSSGARRRWT